MKRALSPPLLTVLLVFIAYAALGAQSTSAVRKLFDQGNAAYDDGDFSAAAKAYQQCIAAGGDGADVLFNLGNAYARQRRLGAALAAYEQALILAPRDSDIRQNMEHVAAQRVATTPSVPRSWLVTVFDRVLRRHTMNELVVLAAAAMLLLAASSLWLLLGAHPGRRQWALFTVLAIGFAVSVSLCLTKYASVWQHPAAYVSVEQATVRSGPGEHFEVTGQLTDGARVEPERRSGLWTEVRLPTGVRAWIEEGNLSRVTPASGS